jgi:hypothetical protein
MCAAPPRRRRFVHKPYTRAIRSGHSRGGLAVGVAGATWIFTMTTARAHHTRDHARGPRASSVVKLLDREGRTADACIDRRVGLGPAFVEHRAIADRRRQHVLSAVSQRPELVPSRLDGLASREQLERSRQPQLLVFEPSDPRLDVSAVRRGHGASGIVERAYVDGVHSAADPARRGLIEPRQR